MLKEGKLDWEFTIYTFDFSLAGNASDTELEPITISKDFWLCQIAPVSTGDFKITIHNTGERRDVLAGVKASALVKDVDAPTPYTLPLLKTGVVETEATGKKELAVIGMEVFSGGSSIQLTVTDISGSANTIQMNLIGYHVPTKKGTLRYYGE